MNDNSSQYDLVKLLIHSCCCHSVTNRPSNWSLPTPLYIHSVLHLSCSLSVLTISYQTCSTSMVQQGAVGPAFGITCVSRSGRTNAVVMSIDSIGDFLLFLYYQCAWKNSCHCVHVWTFALDMCHGVDLFCHIDAVNEQPNNMSSKEKVSIYSWSRGREV